MSLARTVARNSLWSGLDLLVDMILPPIMSIIVARALGPTKLGSFTYVSWLSTTATALAGSGAASAARKYLADYAGQRRPEVFRAVTRAVLIVQIISLSTLCLGGLLWANLALPADERGFASLLMLAIVPGGLMYLATALNMSVQELRPNVVASIIAGLTQTAGLAVALLMDFGLVGIAAATLASRLADCGVRWYMTVRRLPGYLTAMGAEPSAASRPARLPPGLGRKLAVFVAESTVLSVLTLVVWNRSGIVFLKWLSALEEVAFFSVAFGLSLLPGQIVSPFSRAAMVSVYAERGRDAQAGVAVAQIYWRYLVMLVLPASLGLAVMSGPLLRVLYGQRYFDAAPVLLIAAALSMFASLSDPATSLVTAAGGQRRLVMTGIVAAITTLVLDYFLVRAFDAKGAALANGLGQALATIMAVLVARHYAFSVSAGLLVRASGAALGMTALVATANHFLPDIVSIVVGPAVGAVAYGVLVRVARLLDAEDVERFTQAADVLPGPFRAPFRKMLHFLAPPAR